MSKFDERMRKRLIKSNASIREIQRTLTARYVGKCVKILCDRRGCHSRRRYKAGTEFVIYDVLAEGRDVGLWLSRVEDAAHPSFELSVWLYEVEFVSEKKK